MKEKLKFGFKQLKHKNPASTMPIVATVIGGIQSFSTIVVATHIFTQPTKDIIVFCCNAATIFIPIISSFFGVENVEEA